MDGKAVVEQIRDEAGGRSTHSDTDRPASSPLRSHAFPWPKAAVYIAWLLLAAGAAFRLRMFLNNRSLWLDELFLADNLLHRGMAELTFLPMKWGQRAPLGFMWVEKLNMTLWGHSEYVLRLEPLVMGLAGLGLFAALVRRILPAGAGCVAIGLYAISSSLVYFSAELKPYGGDATFATAIVLCALVILHQPRWYWLTALGAIGVVGPWLAHPSVFVLAAVGLVLMIELVRRRRPRTAAVVAGMAGLWLASFMVLHEMTQVDPSQYARLLQTWKNDFAPWPVSGAAIAWYGSKVTDLFYHRPIGTYSASALSAALAILGAVRLSRLNRVVSLMLLLPILLALGASAVKQYAFGERLLMFIAPALLIYLALGVEEVRRILRDRSAALGVVVPLLVILFVVPWFCALLMRNWYAEETRPMFAYVDQRLQPGDTVFLYHWTAVAYDYYGPRFPFEARGVRPIRGILRDGDWVAYARDMEQLRGRQRVWILMSHVLGSGEDDERVHTNLIRLNHLGRQLERHDWPGAVALLYDMSGQEDGS